MSGAEIREQKMSRRESHKDYVIEIIRESYASWKAKVTRKDGAPIRLKYGDRPVLIDDFGNHIEKPHGVEPAISPN